MKYVFIVENKNGNKIGVGQASNYALFVKLTKALEKGGCRVVQVDDPGDESSK